MYYLSKFVFFRLLEKLKIKYYIIYRNGISDCGRYVVYRIWMLSEKAGSINFNY